jgi:hypothetical protein
MAALVVAAAARVHQPVLPALAILQAQARHKVQTEARAASQAHITAVAAVAALLQQDLPAAAAPEEMAEMARPRPFLAVVSIILAAVVAEFTIRAQLVPAVLAAAAQAAVLLLELLEPLIPAAVVVGQEERLRQLQIPAAQAALASSFSNTLSPSNLS